MFWRFGGYANISTIDTILDKPEFTLEELLDESDLIQELKQHNSKLIEYLRGDDILEKLLEYVVAPKLEAVATPSTEDDARGKSRLLGFSRSRASSRATDNDDADDDDEQEKRRNRYALVACEVLSSDTWSIYEALTEKRDLIRKFWSFLERPAPLDPLQASYFTKVNESLFEKKTDDMMELFRTVPNVVPEMLKHVECPMIMDLLLKIIALDRNEGGQGIVEWLYARDIIPTLLSCLEPKHSWVVQTAAGDFIKAIITISANASQNEQQCIGPNELTRQLVSQRCVEQLIGYMLGGGNPLTVGVGIVIEVIRKNNSDYDPDVGSEANTVPSSRDPIYLGTLLRLFAQNVPKFMSLIMEGPSRKDDMGSTFGEKLEPLGFDRFKTCELMAELLHCSNMGLLNEVGSEQLISARDAERQRLRDEGRLIPQSEEDDHSTDNLTMRLSHGGPDEGRRLEITNADDDGFEEVENSKEMSEDTSDEFVKAEDDIAVATPPASFLEKDEDDFVDEPLSSPRLSVTAGKINEQRFDDPDLVVAPLSPTKPKPAEIVTVDDASHVRSVGADGPPESQEAESPKGPNEVDSSKKSVDTTVNSAANAALVVSDDGTLKPGDSQAGTLHRDLSPHPEDTPAPLFSSAGPQEPNHPEVAGSTAGVNEPSGDLVPSTSTEEGHGRDSPAPELLQPQPEGLAAIEPVVGDYLKMQFVEHRVVPAILSFFFSYPWNNFLHNVVYDIVQQVFNGPMDRGYNPTLAVSLFEAADITVAIIKGQQASDESQEKTKTRMGYMGHLTLIAEEVVKFTERHPPELLSEMVLDKVMSQEWINYVEGALAETRERDNAILGGVRPEVALGHRVSIGGSGGSGLGGVGLSGLGGMSTGTSNALTEAGLNGGIELNEGEGTGLGPFAISAGTLMSGFGSSSDEDDDEGEAEEEDISLEFRKYAEQPNDADDSASAPSIPPPPPPPPPLNIPPSRARLQLAARLAMHQKNNQTSTSDDLHHGDEEADSDEPGTDPFGDGYDDVDAGLHDDTPLEGGSRGSWWRSMVGTRNSQNDGGDSDEADDDDEFGDFALAEEDKSSDTLANKDELVLRPLAVNPAKDVGRSSGGLSSLWPFGSRSGDKDNSSAMEGRDATSNSLPSGSDQRGESAVEVTEATRRTSIEEPDDDEQAEGELDSKSATSSKVT